MPECGCDLREICDAYQGRGKYEQILRLDFRQGCDTVSPEQLQAGFCPIYELNNAVLHAIELQVDGIKQSLEGIRGSIERMTEETRIQAAKVEERNAGIQEMVDRI
ncbi:hypothetical protein HYS48_02920 [Candidatus Woesearchaeota archaeon]|nr:hypothetical protein [Candidatus Woesearchaeota archaeon]